MAPGFSFYRLFEKDIDRWAGSGKEELSCGGMPFRIEKRVGFPVDVSAAVVSAAGMDRFYFQDRLCRYEIGAVGRIRAYGENGPETAPISAVEDLWKADPRIVLFGGMGFHEGRPPQEWRAFGAIRFVLPLIEIRKDEKGACAILNACSGESESRQTAADNIGRQLRAIDLTGEVKTGVHQIPFFSESLVPGRQQWHEIVTEALVWLRENGARKVVLGRKKILESLGDPWAPAVLFHRLRAVRENSFLFFCGTENGDAFFGRSPERLFKLENSLLASDAIAGTRPRHEHPEHDSRLAAELMASAKDMEEHRFVVDYIRERLSRMCRHVSVLPSPAPLRLSRLQHIITRITGVVKKGSGPMDILHTLHPTPAVGGMPPEAAKALIRRLEPFDRGWFGAPVGWMSKDAAEFAVGIRSALIRKHALHLFGGAGIVTRSDAEMEWQETGYKMECFARILKM